MLLDTNVLLHNLQFVAELLQKDTDVEIPMLVIEELAKLQHDEHSQGYSARTANRFVENNLSKIKIIPTCREHVSDYFVNVTNDDLILNTAKQNNLTLVTDDINLRIKAKALSIEVMSSKQNFDAKQILDPQVDEDLTESQKNTLFEKGEIDVKTKQYRYVKIDDNAAVHVGNKIKLLQQLKSKHYFELSLKPKNIEQQFVLDALFDSAAKLVTIIGAAGSGKTLLSLLSGLELVKQDKFDNITFIIKPSHVSHKDNIGFLPGELDNKLDPFVQQIFDNLNVIYKNKIPDNLKDLFNSDIIKIVALDFLRGRTFHDSFVIIDEAQNYDIHEIKTVLTRLADSSKAVILGDIEQNDTLLAPDSTGLFNQIYAFKDVPYARHIVLKDSVRGQMSKDASILLH